MITSTSSKVNCAVMKLIRASDIYYFVYNLEEIVTQVLNENQEQY